MSGDFEMSDEEYSPRARAQVSSTLPPGGSVEAGGGIGVGLGPHVDLTAKFRQVVREEIQPLLKEMQAMRKAINNQTIQQATTAREVKELHTKVDKGNQPLNSLVTKSGLLRLRRAVWLQPAIVSNSRNEVELVKNLLAELKENEELVKFDSKSQDDIIKGLHYERNQVKCQVKSKIKLDFESPPDIAVELSSTCSYIFTHLMDTGSEVTLIAYQLAYVMSRYLNFKCPVVGDTAKKQQTEAKRDLWEVVACRLERDASSVEVLKGKIKMALAQGFKLIETKRRVKNRGEEME